MKKIPKEPALKSIAAFGREGYNFILNTCNRRNSNLFQINLILKKVIFTTGAEAAEMFYNPYEMKRRGAVPKRVQKSLTGENAIQTTDAAIHKNRKELFKRFMTRENIAKLTDSFNEDWKRASEDWEARKEVVLFQEVPKVLFRSMCNWMGIPYREEEVEERSQDLIAMVDAFGAIGSRHWRGRKARNRSEQWMEELVRIHRARIQKVPENSPLHAMASLEQENGEFLPARLAAIELLNLLRPTVAITYYIAFGAHALEKHPEHAQKIRRGDKDFTERFIHEVRRFYPIAPFLGATVKKGFVWKGYFFPKDTLVLLDIYGTNRDPRHWERPEEFWPDNFLDWDKSPFDFIPQGGGDYNGHRCPGEWITIELLKASMQQLTQKMEYRMPVQDLEFPLNRIPTYPRSGVILKDVVSESTLASI